MAKKIKHNAVFGNTTAQQEVKALQTPSIDDVDRAKLDQYDKLVDDNAKLHSQLESYVQENIQLKSQINELKNTKPEHIDENVETLQKKCDQLQEENDSYLIKISELSFELVKAQTELNNIRNASTSTNKPAKRYKMHPQPTDMYPKNNGYDSWN